MISVSPNLTASGESLLIRAIAGEQVTFTRFKAGKGAPSGDPSDLTDLVDPVLAFGIATCDTSTAGQMRLEGYFATASIPQNFRWTELGLFAKGEDNVELLYAYAYDGESGEMLKASGTNVLTEQSVCFTVNISTAENITAVIASVVYASKADLDAHKADHTNPHQVTAGQTGIAAEEITVPASAWTASGSVYTATVASTVAKAGNVLDVGIGGSPTVEQYEAISRAKILCTGQAAGTITLTAYGIPPAISVTITVLGVDV